MRMTGGFYHARGAAARRPQAPRPYARRDKAQRMRSFSPFASWLALGLLASPAALGGPKAAARTPASAPSSPASLKVQAPPVAPPALSPPVLKLDVRKLELDNGLRVVFSVDPTSPTIAVDVIYDVGGRNEERGHSGFAHLFEHMMFQGSANVPRGRHFQLVNGHGGQLNGSTSGDRTNYFEMMPRSELPLALWLEADRMRSLDISEKNFENQRAVVKEEYRMRVENAAYVPASIRLEELVFQGYWPYEHPAIGSMADLDAAQLPWVRAFHDAYYGPNNAVLSVAGDFDPVQAEDLVRKFFGNIPRIASIPRYDPGPVPERTSPRDAIVEDLHAELPALLYGWLIPPTSDPDHYALEMTANLLTDGESSRLYRLLVREKSVATDVEASTDRNRGPDAFELTVKLAGGASASNVARLVDEQIALLSRTAPSDAEMTKLRNRAQAHFLLGLQSNLERAEQLAEFELYRGDAELLNLELGRYLSVSAEDIRRVVRKYLTRASRVSVEVKPTPPSPKSSTASPATRGGAN
jgi:predicted Zn-dependent peptidase